MKFSGCPSDSSITRSYRTEVADDEEIRPSHVDSFEPPQFGLLGLLSFRLNRAFEPAVCLLQLAARLPAGLPDPSSCTPSDRFRQALPHNLTISLQFPSSQSSSAPCCASCRFAWTLRRWILTELATNHVCVVHVQPPRHRISDLR